MTRERENRMSLGYEIWRGERPFAGGGIMHSDTLTRKTDPEDELANVCGGWANLLAFLRDATVTRAVVTFVNHHPRRFSLSARPPSVRLDPADFLTALVSFNQAVSESIQGAEGNELWSRCESLFQKVQAMVFRW